MYVYVCVQHMCAWGVGAVRSMSCPHNFLSLPPSCHRHCVLSAFMWNLGIQTHVLMLAWKTHGPLGQFAHPLFSVKQDLVVFLRVLFMTLALSFTSCQRECCRGVKPWTIHLYLFCFQLRMINKVCGCLIQICRLCQATTNNPGIWGLERPSVTWNLWAPSLMCTRDALLSNTGWLWAA